MGWPGYFIANGNHKVVKISSGGGGDAGEVALTRLNLAGITLLRNAKVTKSSECYMINRRTNDFLHVQDFLIIILIRLPLHVARWSLVYPSEKSISMLRQKKPGLKEQRTSLGPLL
jgi:hypothetical protein